MLLRPLNKTKVKKRRWDTVAAGGGVWRERPGGQKKATSSGTFFMQFHHNWKAKNYKPLAKPFAESLYSLCAFF